MNGVTAAAATYNAVAVTERATKYISDMNITAATGAILATMQGATSGLPTAVQATTITITPNVNRIAIAGTVGAIDWACAR